MAGKGPQPGVLTIYMGKPEILVGKSNGSQHLVWEGTENNGLWFQAMQFFYSHFSLFGKFVYTM